MRMILATLVLTSGLACEKTIKEVKAPVAAPVKATAAAPVATPTTPLHA